MKLEKLLCTRREAGKTTVANIYRKSTNKRVMSVSRRPIQDTGGTACAKIHKLNEGRQGQNKVLVFRERTKRSQTQ